MTPDFPFFDKTMFAALAGAMGGAVRWLTLRERWSDGLISVVVGAIVATYFSQPMTPVLVALVQSALRILEPVTGPVVLNAGDFGGSSGFLIGLGGMAIVGMGLDFWRNLKERSDSK